MFLADSGDDQVTGGGRADPMDGGKPLFRTYSIASVLWKLLLSFSDEFGHWQRSDGSAEWKRFFWKDWFRRKD